MVNEMLLPSSGSEIFGHIMVNIPLVFSFSHLNLNCIKYDDCCDTLPLSRTSANRAPQSAPKQATRRRPKDAVDADHNSIIKFAAAIDGQSSATSSMGGVAKLRPTETHSRPRHMTPHPSQPSASVISSR